MALSYGCEGLENSWRRMISVALMKVKVRSAVV
jgi:hypothetical protein